MLSIRFNSTPSSNTLQPNQRPSRNAFDSAIKRVAKNLDLRSLGKTDSESQHSSQTRIISVCSGVSLADFLGTQPKLNIQNTDDLSEITLGSEFRSPRRTLFNFDFKSKYQAAPAAITEAPSRTFQFANAQRSTPIPIPTRKATVTSPRETPIGTPEFQSNRAPFSPASGSKSLQGKSLESSTNHVMPFEMEL